MKNPTKLSLNNFRTSAYYHNIRQQKIK